MKSAMYIINCIPKLDAACKHIIGYTLWAAKMVFKLRSTDIYHQVAKPRRYINIVGHYIYQKSNAWLAALTLIL